MCSVVLHCRTLILPLSGVLQSYGGTHHHPQVVSRSDQLCQKYFMWHLNGESMFFVEGNKFDCYISFLSFYLILCFKTKWNAWFQNKRPSTDDRIQWKSSDICMFELMPVHSDGQARKIGCLLLFSACKFIQNQSQLRRIVHSLQIIKQFPF